MHLIQLRFGKNKEYSALALLSLLLVAALHLIHWFAAPVVMTMSAGAAHSHHLEGRGNVWTGLMMFGLIVFTIISIIFAVTQLRVAMKNKEKSVHTYLCSATSLVSIIAGCYTFIIM
jgi:hypothetical protein